MRRVVLCVLLSLGNYVWAEGQAQGPQQGAPGAASAGPGGGGPSAAGRSIPTWDDRVFDLSPREDSAPTLSKGGRVLDRESGINYRDRQRILDNCAAIQDKDPDAYRKCYRQGENNVLEKLNRQKNEVELRQSQPALGGNPLLNERRYDSLGD